MTKHTHEWRLSYTMKTSEGTTTMYYCKWCKSFKPGKPKEQVERGSNRGGEFSTGWRP